MPSATAVFKAVADFASLNREVDKTAAKLALLKKEASNSDGAKDFEANLTKMANAQSKLRGETDKLSTSFARAEKAATSSAEKHTSALKSEQDAANSKIDSLNKLAQHLQGIAQAERDATDAGRGHTDSLKSESTALSKSEAAHRSHAEALKETARESENASRSTDRLGESTRRSGTSSQQSRSLFSSLASELRNLDKSSKDTNLSLGSVARSLLLIIIPAAPAFIGALVGSLVALGGALVGVIGAAGPAVGALAALGPAALAVAGAVGTAALAFKGIGTALKALTSAQSSSANTAAQDSQKAASAARGLANAEDALRSAQRARAQAEVEGSKQVEAADKALARAHTDVKNALADLNAEREQAVRDLKDMQDAEIDAKLSVESAEIALIDAQQAQAKTNVDATATDLDKRKAALQVAEAEQRLSEAKTQSTRATEDNTKAQAAGVDGAANVVSATNRVADAKDAESEAVQAAADARTQAADRILSADEAVVHAQRALEAAQEDAANSADKQTASSNKLAEAMSHLSPAGKEFVYFLQSLIPLVDKVSGAAQTAFLPGLETAIKSLIPLIDSVAIPSIKAFGAVLSSLAIDGAKEIKSFESDFLSFGTGPGPELVDNFGHILLNLLDVILNLSMAAIPLLQWLTKLTLAWSEHVKATTQAKRDTGELADFFDKVKNVLTVLGNILKNVGGILHQVFAAAAPLGMRLLQSFEDLTKKTNDYLHTAEGFGKLKKYFDDMEPSIRIILQLLGMLAKSILATGASKTTYELLVAVRDVLVPAFKRLSDAMHEVSLSIGKELIDIIAKLADALTNLINAGGGGGISAFVTVLDAFATVLKAITSVPGLAQLGVWLLAIAGGLKAVKLVGSITGLSKVASGLNAIGGRAASYKAGEAAPTSKSPTTFVGGVTSAASGSTETPRTLTSRAGAAVGSKLRSAVVGTPPTYQTPIPASQAPVYPPGTSRTPPAPPSRLSSAASAVGRVAAPVARVGAGIAGSIGGAVAGAAIGQKIGGDTGSVVGGIAGSIAGSYAPDAIAAGLSKVAPLAEKAKSALAGVGSTLAGAVAGAAKSGGSALVSAAGSALQLAGSVASAAGSYIKLGVETLAANARQLIFAAGAAIVRGATAAWAAVQWVLNAAMNANPISLVIIAITALVAAFIYAWTHSETFRDIVISVLQAVGDFFVAIWEKGIKPIWDAFWGAIDWVGNKISWFWNNIVTPAWTGVGNIISGIWNNVVKPTWDAFFSLIHTIGDAVSWFWNNVVTPAWNGVGNIISSIYNSVIKPIFDGFMAVVHAIGDSFNWAIGVIQTAWNKLGDIAKAPVNFVIGVVYNQGIVPLWNDIAGLFGLGKLAPARLLAEGGVLPGYAPGRDSVGAILSPGEGILVPEAVKALGPDFVYRANAAFSGGRVSANPSASTASVRSGQPQRFAVGGIVGNVASAISTMVSDPVGSIKTLFSDVLNKVIPGSGSFHDALTKIPSKVIDAVIEKAKAYAAQALAAMSFTGGGSVPGGGTAGTERWRGVGTQALQIAGQGVDNINRLLYQMSTESSGNPTAINRVDVNWQKGTPSVGLMQVIGPTYARYHHPSYNAPPFEYGVSEDPMSNILSSIRYTLSAYGSLAAGWQGHGYAGGGRVAGSGDTVPAWLTPGEFILSKQSSQALGMDLLTRLNQLDVGHAADLFSPVGRDAVPTLAIGAGVRAGLEAALSVGRGSSSSVVHGDTASKDVVINTNIYNPVAEKASDSAASRMRTLSAMGMFN